MSLHKVEINFGAEAENKQVWQDISLAARKRQIERFKSANTTQGPPESSINDKRSSNLTNRGVDGLSQKKQMTSQLQLQSCQVLASCMQYHTCGHNCLECVRLVEFSPLLWTSSHSTCNLDVEFLPSASLQKGWPLIGLSSVSSAFTLFASRSLWYCLASLKQTRQTLLQSVCFHLKAGSHTQMQTGKNTNRAFRNSVTGPPIWK